MSDSKILIPKIANDLVVTTFNDASWQDAQSLTIAKDWSGSGVSAHRQFTAKALWSDVALVVLFAAKQNESLVVTETPDLSVKTIGLWEQDVCEIFIAPNKSEPRRYFEFEVAPTGEWLDLAIDMTSGERVAEWDYKSGMETAARIEENKVTMAIKIPWEAFGQKPKAGEVWLGNIFRCVGKEPDRSYLAWRPTMTEKPNFHVPEAFGEFHFVQNSQV